MSHFPVLVIGPDVDGQLAPYDENLEVEEHKEYEMVDADSWTGKHLVEKDPDLDLNDQAAVVEALEAKGFGTYGFDDDGIFRLSTYNPESRWDWYQVGGRWTGYFKLKEGAQGHTGKPGLMTEAPPEGWVDVARKVDIDFEAMAATEAERAALEWDTFWGIVTGHGWTPVDFADFMPEAPIEERRHAWWNMPVIKDLQAAHVMSFTAKLTDTFGPDRDAHIAAAGRGAAVTYAVVKDGEWHERGSMGWFGLSSGDMEQGDWQTIWWKMVDSLDDNELLTVVDCHI